MKTALTFIPMSLPFELEGKLYSYIAQRSAKRKVHINDIICFMTSPIRNKLVYIPFLSGLVLGVLVIVVANTLRFLDNSSVVVATQAATILALGSVSGFLLRNVLKHQYIIAIFALFYTYALSVPIKAITDMIHYGLSALVTALIAIAAFSLSNVFFNRLKLHMAVKLPIAIVLFGALFIFCSLFALYVLRLTYTLW